jgi:putative transposase
MKSHDFKKLARIQSNARLRTRYLAISHFLNDVSRADIASYLKISRTSVNAWVHKYLNQGNDGLVDGKSPGRPCKLTAL